MENCPNCKSSRIVEGVVVNQPDYLMPGAYFRPKYLKPFVWSGINVNFKNNFWACLDCGYVFSILEKEKLKKVVKEKVKDYIKSKFNL